MYRTAIEELALSGTVSLGRCSDSTVRRYKRAINEMLEHEKADWRVTADVKDRSLTAVMLEGET